ncbi:flagellar hook-length control protein FliK [Bradyrhizobium sp. BRP22]|uniref:flagellar hook-length control protein FliK n=1 Tax=Bradyrhizobium sp. BRP22 TaxID=2793821 RepID=UPI001CD1B478|nr:flagellar hook-length control protein FliK [Bradyrhizobium sp. BRP22]
MVNVAQETLAGISFQANSPRSSTRSDSGPAPGNDSFAALVDSNTAVRDERPDDSSRPPPASARRNDDPAPADARSPDDRPGSDRPERNDTPSDAGSSGRADKSDQAGSKSDTPKSDSAKSSKPKDDAPAKDDVKEGDEPKQDDGTAVVTVITAAVSAVVTGPANAAPATAPVSDTATTPLTTAAAAIAAVASVAGTAPAAANAAKADVQANAQADAQAIAAVSDGEQAIAGTATTIAVALPAAAAAATPQAKAAAQSKPTLTTKDAIPTSGAQDSTTDSTPTDAPTGIVPDITPPTAAAGKQKAEHAFVDAVKADASGDSTQTPAANIASHAQAATAHAAQTLAAASDNGAQAIAMMQPQMPSTPTTPSANPQLTVTAATTQSNAVPVSGLAMEIAATAKSGKSRFEIRLDPPELGRIDVRIHVDNNGQVTSHLTVERPETLQMLRQDANQLQRALDNAGLSTGNGGLQFSLRDQSSGQNGGNQSNPNAHRLIVSEEDSVPAPVVGRSYGRMLGASGSVDIRI